MARKLKSRIREELFTEKTPKPLMLLHAYFTDD